LNEQEFKDRTKRFALRVIRLVEALPRKQAAQVIGKQLLRSGTSVGANYRAACRAKSTLDIIHKLNVTSNLKSKIKSQSLRVEPQTHS
jgi:four helix bundle protein